MIIREETPEEAAEIRSLVTAAFPEPLEAELVDQLRAAGDSVISMVAVDGGQLAGHALLSKMTAPFRALGLGPVCVLPDRQRAGVGTRLITASLDRAAKDGWEAIFVLGNPKFYRRFGFDQVAASGFTSPYAGPHFMVLMLRGDLAVTMGKIECAPAFAALERDRLRLNNTKA